MLPQLDSSFYQSQLFWLLACLIILVIAFKKCFVPRISSILLKRNSFISKGSNEIKALESDIAKLEEELRVLKELEIRKSSEIIKNAVKKSETLLDEQLETMKYENERIVNKVRTKLGDEIKNLELVFKSQIDVMTQTIYEKLFS